MDRLPALIVAAAAACAVACDDASPAASAPVPEGRVNAVMASRKQPSFADLCDVAASEASAEPFTWPALEQAAAPGGANFRWVNVWATWCKPCIEELPLLARVFEQWRKQGQSVSLTLVSVDADAAAARQFLADRPALPATLQLTDPAAATTWLQGVGLATGASIPVHMVLDAQDRLRCARSGGIALEDLERFHGVMFP